MSFVPSIRLVTRIRSYTSQHLPQHINKAKSAFRSLAPTNRSLARASHRYYRSLKSKFQLFQSQETATLGISPKFPTRNSADISLWISMAAAIATTSTTTSWWNWSWRPTSAQQLETAETAMLTALKTPFELKLVVLENGEFINTLVMGQGPPLVMIHGFGGGLALFAANLESLAENFTVYAIDLPGFGRSSRPPFEGHTAAEAESYFVSRFDLWMDAVGLENAIIMGHSLGAFLSASWALSHPHRFQRLILADPFGVPRKPNKDPLANAGTVRRFLIKGIRAVSSSPLTLLRAAGPLGPGLIRRLRPDLLSKFQHMHPDSEVTAGYIYHLNAQSPATGEEAFTKIMTGLGYAEMPLIDRLPELDRTIPVSIIYGEESWMRPSHGVWLRESMPNHNIDLAVIPNAGHHVYIDQWGLFNHLLFHAAQGTLGPLTQSQYRNLLRYLKEKKERKLQDMINEEPAAAATAAASS